MKFLPVSIMYFSTLFCSPIHLNSIVTSLYAVITGSTVCCQFPFKGPRPPFD